MNTRISKFDTDDKFIKYLLIAMMPILSLYVFLPLLNIGYFIILITLLFSIIMQRFKVNINIKMLVVMSLLIVINLTVGIIKYEELTVSINNTAGMFVFTFFACVLTGENYLDIDKLYKACKYVSTVATIFLIYQYIEYHFRGNVISGQIPFFTLEDFGFRSITYGRPSSFFSEPAHYSIYIAPIYMLALIRKEYKISLLYLIGLGLSTSSTGIFIAVLAPSVVFLKKYRRNVVRIFFVIVLLTLFLILLNNVLTIDFFEKFRIINLFNNIRVFGSLEYFKYFDIYEILFGIGLNQLIFFSVDHDFIAYNYANSYIFSIISFGLIGGSIWTGYNISIFKSVNSQYKAMCFVFVVISLSDQLLFNRNLLYLLIWLFSASYRKKVRKN